MAPAYCTERKSNLGFEVCFPPSLRNPARMHVSVVDLLCLESLHLSQKLARIELVGAIYRHYVLKI